MNYIDNKKFYQQIVNYRKKCKEYEEAGKERPVIPDEIARYFIALADNIATKSNFYTYTWLDDMKADGITACIRYFHKYDPEKYDNPFAYFTMFMYNAFINRINIEKKQSYIRAKQFIQTENVNISNDEEGFSVDGIYNIIDNYEKKMEEKKQRLKEQKDNKKFEE